MKEVKGIKVVDNSLNTSDDMPKIKSPFIRQENDKGHYVAIDEINEGYEWMFKDDNVRAIEKIDGTSVSVKINNGNIISVYNRTNRVPALNKGKQYITKGLLNSIKRNYLNLDDGQWFGELVGPKVQGNPYDLNEPLWIPFKRYSQKHLEYNSWGKYPKNLKTISRWFKEDLIPLFYAKIHGVSFDKARKNGFVEGIVFTHKDGRMAKIRRDFFEWYYKE